MGMSAGAITPFFILFKTVAERLSWTARKVTGKGEGCRRMPGNPSTRGNTSLSISDKGHRDTNRDAECWGKLYRKMHIRGYMD
jgi:hypothetical protein